MPWGWGRLAEGLCAWVPAGLPALFVVFCMIHSALWGENERTRSVKKGNRLIIPSLLGTWELPQSQGQGTSVPEALG